MKTWKLPLKPSFFKKKNRLPKSPKICLKMLCILMKFKACEHHFPKLIPLSKCCNELISKPTIHLGCQDERDGTLDTFDVKCSSAIQTFIWTSPRHILISIYLKICAEINILLKYVKVYLKRSNMLYTGRGPRYIFLLVYHPYSFFSDPYLWYMKFICIPELPIYLASCFLVFLS